MPEEEKKKVSKAQQAAVAKYTKAHYDEFKLRFPRGYKDEIQAAAEQAGESVNGYIKTAVDQRLGK